MLTIVLNIIIIILESEVLTMFDEELELELYELVRDNYLKCNKEYIEEQLRICNEEIAKLEANKNEVVLLNKCMGLEMTH